MRAYRGETLPTEQHNTRTEYIYAIIFEAKENKVNNPYQRVVLTQFPKPGTTYERRPLLPGTSPRMLTPYLHSLALSHTTAPHPPTYDVISKSYLYPPRACECACPDAPSVRSRII